VIPIAGRTIQSGVRIAGPMLAATAGRNAANATNAMQTIATAFRFRRVADTAKRFYSSGEGVQLA
jgi:hypothetical protein